jgi:hypothetical protein
MTTEPRQGPFEVMSWCINKKDNIWIIRHNDSDNPEAVKEDDTTKEYMQKLLQRLLHQNIVEMAAYDAMLNELALPKDVLEELLNSLDEFKEAYANLLTDRTEIIAAIKQIDSDTDNFTYHTGTLRILDSNKNPK